MGIRQRVQSQRVRAIEQEYTNLSPFGVDLHLDRVLTRWACSKNFYDLREVGRAVRELRALDIHPFEEVSNFDEVVDRSDTFAPRQWHARPEHAIEVEEVKTAVVDAGEDEAYAALGKALCELILGQPGQQMAEVIRLYPPLPDEGQQAAVS